MADAEETEAELATRAPSCQHRRTSVQNTTLERRDAVASKAEGWAEVIAFAKCRPKGAGLDRASQEITATAPRPGRERHPQPGNHAGRVAVVEGSRGGKKASAKGLGEPRGQGKRVAVV